MANFLMKHPIQSLLGFLNSIDLDQPPRMPLAMSSGYGTVASVATYTGRLDC